MLVALNPVSKPRQSQRDRWLVGDKARPAVKKYRDFADALRIEALNNAFHLGDKVYLEFHIEMPKSWSKKKKIQNLNTPHQVPKSKDIDNLIKSVLDVLRPDDDGCVHYCEAKKFWTETGRGRILIENKS